MKKTQNQLAKDYGIGLTTLKRYKSDGIDIYNEEEVLEYKASQADCGANTSLVEDDVEEGDTDPSSMLQLKQLKLKHETNIKARQAELLKLEVDEKRGDLISLTEVAETNTAIGSKVKARLKAMCISLPPQLEGLNIREMSKKIELAIQDVLESLYEELNVDE